jgi:DNA polymerase
VSFSDTSTAPDAAAIAAALQWWREAGVEHSFADSAATWLTAPEPEVTAGPATYVPPQPPAPPPRPLIGGDPVLWPQDLAGFHAWWLSEPLLDSGQLEGRIAPRGSAGAQMMVLVDHSEAEDREQLLSGPLGKLLGAILAAIGVAPEQAYFASVLPRHMPHPDWDDLAETGLAELTRHHIALAAPQRVICFGNHVSSLLGHDPAKSADSFKQITLSHGAVSALMAPRLEDLMGRPRVKAKLWQALLDWQTA